MLMVHHKLTYKVQHISFLLSTPCFKMEVCELETGFEPALDFSAPYKGAAINHSATLAHYMLLTSI